MGDIVGGSDFGTDPVKARLIVESFSFSVPTTASVLKGTDNIIGLSDVGFGR